jgi:3-hydroxyisobutyrate dehydrogenase-like beta-hydroxyacid dehydrogenase
MHHLGQPRWIGAELHLSTLVKLAGNQMMFTTVEMLGEIFAIFRKAGIAEAEVKALLVDTLFPGRSLPAMHSGWPIATGRGCRAACRSPEDTEHCLAAADTMGAELPLFQFLRDRIAAVSDAAFGPADIAALARQVAIESGLSV